MNINLTLIAVALAFAAFIWFTARFVWPPLMRAIETRQKNIADGLAAGEQGRQDLAQAEARVTATVNEAKARATEIVALAEKQRNATIDKSKSEALAEAAKVTQAKLAELEQEIARAKEVLRNQVADLAVQGAQKILSREINPQVHADLLNKLKAEL
ncbi:MAG: F0F1 ATP synthase subunit B [Betaproteobacteria bacterium]|nr:F0F1 ATP synthase subunit B [Betaproteobacteria bacterium]